MSDMRTFKRRALRGLLSLGLLVGAASAAWAQAAHLGPRVGGNFDNDEALVGAHVSLPLTSWLDFYPSFNAYFPQLGTRLGFNADAKLRFPPTANFQFYTGGGFGLLYRDIGGISDTDPGVNMLGGVDARIGRVHPFVEARVGWHDNTMFQLMTGLNFTLGGRR